MHLARLIVVVVASVFETTAVYRCVVVAAASIPEANEA